jgi:integrase
MAGRRNNGEGTIYRRKDGRYEGAAYFLTTSGKRKRVRVYGATRQEVHDKLTEAKVRSQQGIPVPDRSYKLGEYLDYWLEHVVRTNRRPKTYEQYEIAARLYLKPGLGSRQLIQLSVPIVQSFLNQKIKEGHSIRKVQIIRTALSAALTRAQREELVGRNVARLVELPEWQRQEIYPWSAVEAKQFLDAARDHVLQPAFLLLILYGLRRGEVLGLRWRDVDFEKGEVRIRQQLQRVGRELAVGPLKTKASQRKLPLLGLVRQALMVHQKRQRIISHAASTARKGTATTEELVFTTRIGSPIEPRNFVRSFWSICEASEIRVIKLHHLRHTTATLLKNLGVPARDAQLILGHSNITTTQELYQHDDLTVRRDALRRVERLFFRTVGSLRCRQKQPSVPWFGVWDTAILSGGPSGDRTHDTLLKSSISGSVRDRLTAVDAVMQVCTRQWLLGVVAVNLAVKPSSAGI